MTLNKISMVHKRFFSYKFKRETAEKVLGRQLKVTNVLDEDGKAIHYGVVENWVREYQLGKFGKPQPQFMVKLSKARSIKVRPLAENIQLTPAVPASAMVYLDNQEMLKLFKTVVSLQEEVSMLRAQLSNPGQGDRRKPSVYSDIMPIIQRTMGR